MKTRRKAFTLIELLVVIAVIALLMSILMPALNAAREQSRRVGCGQNERSTGMALLMYANDYSGKLPLNSVDAWVHDVSYWTTDIILASAGSDRHIFYCPSWKQRDDIVFWRFSENLPSGTSESYDKGEPEGDTRKSYYRIVGYYWLLDTVSGRKNAPMSSNGTEQWVRTLFPRGGQAPASVEMITDATASDGPTREGSDFTKATGGCWSRWQVYDRTNHLTQGEPKGGNILFVDGHVEWRAFTEMEHRWFWQSNANPCFWW